MQSSHHTPYGTTSRWHEGVTGRRNAKPVPGRTMRPPEESTGVARRGASGGSAVWSFEPTARHPVPGATTLSGTAGCNAQAPAPCRTHLALRTPPAAASGVQNSLLQLRTPALRGRNPPGQRRGSLAVRRPYAAGRRSAKRSLRAVTCLSRACMASTVTTCNSGRSSLARANTCPRQSTI